MKPAPPAASPSEEPAVLCVRIAGDPDQLAAVLVVVRAAVGEFGEAWLAVRGDAAELNAVLERQGWPVP